MIPLSQEALDEFGIHDPYAFYRNQNNQQEWEELWQDRGRLLRTDNSELMALLRHFSELVRSGNHMRIITHLSKDGAAVGSALMQAWELGRIGASNPIGKPQALDIAVGLLDAWAIATKHVDRSELYRQAARTLAEIEPEFKIGLNKD